MELLRVVAIVAVVAGHVNLGMAAAEVRHLDQLFSNSTALFVFISGFLFFHLNRNTQYPELLSKKLAYVLVPYLVLTGVTWLVRRLLGAPLWPNAFLGLLVGAQTWAHLWYIPVILSIFVISPLLLAFVQRGRWFVVSILVVLFAVSFFSTRDFLMEWVRSHAASWPGEVRRWVALLEVPSRLLHFLSFFFLGMVLARFRDRLVPLLTKDWVITGFLSAAVAFYLTALFWTTNGDLRLANLPLINLNQLYWFALAAAFVGMAFRWVDRRARTVSLVAEASFGIYFLHFPLLMGVKQLGLSRWLGDGGVPAVLQFFVIASLVFLASLLAVLVLKRLLGRWSRNLIGS